MRRQPGVTAAAELHRVARAAPAELEPAALLAAGESQAGPAAALQAEAPALAEALGVVERIRRRVGKAACPPPTRTRVAPPVVVIRVRAPTAWPAVNPDSAHSPATLDSSTATLRQVMAASTPPLRRRLRTAAAAATTVRPLDSPAASPAAAGSVVVPARLSARPRAAWERPPATVTALAPVMAASASTEKRA